MNPIIEATQKSYELGRRNGFHEGVSVSNDSLMKIISQISTELELSQDQVIKVFAITKENMKGIRETAA